MTRPCLLALVAIFGCWISGCNQDDPSTGPDANHVTATSRQGESSPQPSMAIAVVDLDAVAQRVGRIDETKAAIKQKESELNDKLNLLVSSYENDLKLERDKLGEEANADQKKDFLLLQQRLTTNVKQAQLSARQELTLHKNTMLTRFREQVKPIALEVAKSHGMSVVLTANLVFAAEGTVDITNEVVEQYLKRFASATSPAPESTSARQGDEPTRVSHDTRGGSFQN